MCSVRTPNALCSSLLQASKHYLACLDIRKRIYGAEAAHGSIAQCYEKLGEIHVQNGNFDEAKLEYVLFLEMISAQLNKLCRVFREHVMHYALILVAAEPAEPTGFCINAHNDSGCGS